MKRVHAFNSEVWPYGPINATNHLRSTCRGKLLHPIAESFDEILRLVALQVQGRIKNHNKK